MNPPNPGDDSRARRIAVVHPSACQRAELEERRSRVEQRVDTLAGEHFAALFYPNAKDQAIADYLRAL